MAMFEQNRWKDVDGALRALAKQLCAADFEIGELLLAAEDSKPWLPYGYRSIYEYASRLFGWGYIATCERLRVAKALCEMRLIAEELKSGRMTYSIVREMTRIAVPETEADWIEELAGKTVRVVEAKVARHKRGDGPEDRGDPGLVRHRMHLEFTPRQWAIVTQRLAEMRTGDPTLTDEELVSLLALTEISGGNETGASFRIQVRVEPDGTAFMEGGAGEDVEVPPSTLECAQCDAEVWEHTADGPLKPVKRKPIPAAVERQLKALAKGRCECCGLPIKPQKHHVDLVSEGGSNDLSNLILSCEAHHTRLHEGTLIIEGARETGWIFKHADGSLYGDADLDASRLEASSEAFAALRTLGYQEKLIRRALAGIRATSPDLSTQDLIRAALNTLQRKRYRVVPHAAPTVGESEARYRSFPRGKIAAPTRARCREFPLGETAHADASSLWPSFHVETPPAETRRRYREFPRGNSVAAGARARRRKFPRGNANPSPNPRGGFRSGFPRTTRAEG